MLVNLLASVCLLWYLFVVVVCVVGYIQLLRHYLKHPNASATALGTHRPRQSPHVTIIRPVKGLEPALYECLAASFHQTYAKDKFTIYFCITSRSDPAFPILEQLLADFADFDVHVTIEEEDSGRHSFVGLGPNPKIRNMSRAYHEAKQNIVWIIDCNVWVGPGACERMVDKLCGTGEDQASKKYKFVHHLPLAVDISPWGPPDATFSRRSYVTPSNGELTKPSPMSYGDPQGNQWRKILALGGGRMEEVFMSSSHAKFYTAINTVLVAPCIVGKSTMFRKFHLDYLTKNEGGSNEGIDFFSSNICEDHLIGDLLWKGQVPEENAGELYGKHALVFGDLAIHPIQDMSVADYVARRIRWLRVRKFTVTLATLVEPGTESFLCSLYGAFALTSSPFLCNTFRISPTWSTFWLLWISSVTVWAFADWILYLCLHSGRSVELDVNTPDFVKQPSSRSRRRFTQWILAWLGREMLAFPVWFWAVCAGSQVVWRGQRFGVGIDMKVHAIPETQKTVKDRYLVGGTNASKKLR